MSFPLLQEALGLLRPIQNIIERLLPDRVEALVRSETARSALVTAVDSALVAANVTARLIPEDIRRRLIRRQIDLIVDELLLPGVPEIDVRPAVPVEPARPTGGFVLTDAGRELLLRFEVGGGADYYNKKLKSPTFPGFSSGVTIGIGYDLGYNSLDQFTTDWQERLLTDDFSKLTECLGINAGQYGGRAKITSLLPTVSDVVVPWNDALAVFAHSTIPRYWKMTVRVFPGAEALALDIEAALLSLVFNRGTSLQGERRREMRAIRAAIVANQIKDIPREIRKMKRLWEGPETESNLLGRREAEARLVERALFSQSVVIDIGEGPEQIESRKFSGEILQSGASGAEVEAVQKALSLCGIDSGPLDGEFGPLTLRAVLVFQRRNELTADGEVGPVTWGALFPTVAMGESRPTSMGEALRIELASFARTEAGKQLSWNSASSEAEKYLEPFRMPMQRLGQIGSSPVFYNWCAAWVTYCCREVGIKVPDQPAGFGATMALVQSWRVWANQNGYLLEPEQATLCRGDIVTFEWFDGDSQPDHIGIVQEHMSGSTTFLSSEGNKSNHSGNFNRSLKNVSGIIRIRERLPSV